MTDFLTSLTVLTPIVNRVVELFKAWLATQKNIDAELRSAIVFTAQILVALVVMVGTYTTSPVATGTILDKYPVVVILLGTGLLATGSEVIYKLLEVVKRLQGPKASGPVG